MGPLFWGLLAVACEGPAETVAVVEPEPTRLHWFIPDGTRADPEVFDVFAWAQQGKLPNLKKLMDRGAYGYSIPTFPSHTPTNFATLLTGAWPSSHGVADGPMRAEGAPLARPSVGGFRSTARKLPAIWSVLESSHDKIILLSMPGSTPPELQPGGITIRGRWGGWGADLPSVLFEPHTAERVEALGREARLFMLGEELTRFVEKTPPEPWRLPSDTEALWEVTLEAHGFSVHALAVDTDQDGTPDSLRFSQDRAAALADLAEGEWSEWIPTELTWKDKKVSSNVRLNVVRLKDDGHFRVRLLVDALNRFVTEPATVAEPLKKAAGPMVDFVDNFPAQLIHYPEDKDTFLSEVRQSLAWHKSAVPALYEQHHPDVFVHDIYTPNQMLTSRWWMGALDPASQRYGDYSDAEREKLWAEVHELYQGLDAILGEAMKAAGDDALVVFSSDHGAAPMNRNVRLNNHFAEQGWLSVTEDPKTGAPIVDWDASKVVFLQMYSVYIDPEGLGGNWTRASGEAYEALRTQVIASLEALQDADGTHPVASVVRWEDAGEQRRIPADRIGDLVVSNQPGFGWSEETTGDGQTFITPLATGYKQAIEPGSTQAVWTPFVIAGPGVKAGAVLSEPIRHIDQLPTLLTALGLPIPDHVQGRVLTEILE
jgi:predicted AlkP superfamily phosphohydrolase/phosphomutase